MFCVRAVFVWFASILSVSTYFVFLNVAEGSLQECRYRLFCLGYTEHNIPEELMEEHTVQRQQQQQQQQEAQQHLEEISSEPILIEENSVVVNGGH